MLKIEAKFPDLKQKCQITLTRAYVQIVCLPQTNYATSVVWRAYDAVMAYVALHVSLTAGFFKQKLRH